MSNNLKKMQAALIGFLLLCAANLSAQTVKGTITDQAGEPIIGATVMEDGVQGNGTVTDLDGNYSITLKGAKKALKITYIGMKAQTIQVGSRTTVDVRMEDDANNLNDVVVIGYGTVRKKDLTGSVASIGADKLADIPVSNVGEAMQGKLAGVNITTTEGSPDADVKIRVRGGGSLSQDNSPLYIVDGFPASSISDIAPSEIESIDVLKDASSTAIYGARGANGVVIITTKSGKEGKTQVSLNAALSWKKLTKELKVMDPYNYVAYQQELGSTDYGDYDDLDIWRSVAGHDWQDELFGRTGFQQQYNANVSGGSKDIKYNVSYARNQEKSIMQGSGYAKNNIGAKINATINKWLSLDFNARLAYSTIDGLSGGAEQNQSNAANSIVANVVRFRPVTPLSTGDDDDESTSSSTLKDPFTRMNATNRKQRRFRQDYNAGLNWKPWKHFTFRSEFGYGWRYEDDNYVWAADAVQNSKFGYSGQPQLDYTHREYRNWRNANTVTYDNDRLFGGRDRITVLLGHEWSSTKQTNRENTVVAFPSSMTIAEIKANTAAGTALPLVTTIAQDDNMLSFFGRINYTLDEKYLATFTLRADGSSKFGDDHRWGYFPSLALAWRMSDEAWLKNVTWLSNLKARLSFGTAGNNRIPSGQLMPTYSMASNSTKAPFFNETRTAQLERGTYLYNPDLKWETTVTRNFGVDYGFLGGRINGTLDLYWNTTKDLLMRAEIPSNTGYSYQYQNFGKTSNKGIEFTVNGVIVDQKDFTLNATANISWNKNNIDELNTDNPWQSSNFAGSTIAKYEDFSVAEGGRLGEVWGYKTNGFFTAYDAEKNPNGELVYSGGKWQLRDGLVDNSPTLTGGQYYPGGLKYVVDEDGNPVKQKLGNTIPTVTGGFGLSGTFKGFDFNVFFDYSLGNQIVNGTKLANSFYAGSARGYNLVSDFNVANRYTWIDPATGMNLGRSISASTLAYYGGAEGVASRLCEINANANIYNPAAVSNMYINDWAVEDASFLRLNTVTIGYTFPKAWVQKLFLTNLRVYFTAYNLACITGYDGYDPEVDTSSKRNAMCPGIDYAAYPKSRSFTAGLNITF